MKRTRLRAAAGASLILISSFACDARSTGLGNGGGTGGLEDVPRVSIDVPAARNDSVLIATALSATIRATDNLSLHSIYDSVHVQGTLVRSDSVRFTTATPGYNNTISVPVSGMRDGDIVRIVAYARDGNGNWGFAVRTLTVYDTTAPKVTVVAPLADKVVRPGGADSIRIQAVDSSGIALVGYHLYRDSVLTPASVPSFTTSTTLTGGPTNITRAFPPAFNLPPGRYFIRGFADDLSARRGHSSLRGMFVQDTQPPVLVLRNPLDGGNIQLADTVLAEAFMSDTGGLARLTIVGIAIRGNPNLGPTDTVVMYDTASVPVSGDRGPAPTLPCCTVDTTVYRLMPPKGAIAQMPDTIVLFIAKATDRAGNVTTVTHRVRRVSGPRMSVDEPVQGDSVSRNQLITVQVTGNDTDGIRSVGYRISGSTFTYNRSTTIAGTLPTTYTWTDTVTIPASAVIGEAISITPTGSDAGGRAGSGTTILVYVGSTISDVAAPRVYQTVPARLQSTDSLFVRGEDNSGVSRVGYYMFHLSTGALIASGDSVLSSPYVSGNTVRFRFNVPSSYVGDSAYVISYAYDALNNRGWSLRTGITTTQTDSVQAKRDTTWLVYGTTNRAPTGAVAGDLAASAVNGQVFMSNISQNRINVWRASDSTWFSSIAVGSEPWGMAVDTTGDTLFVANSGGTNFSVVSFTSLREERRIKTQNSLIAEVSFSRDVNGLWRYSVVWHDFSDRPQYVGVSENGNLFYSTRPTPTAPAGTIRYYDMRLREVQQMWQYGAPGATGKILVLNADSVFAVPSFNPNISDQIRICGHQYGNPTTGRCRQAEDIFVVANDLRTLDGVQQLVLTATDVNSLKLTDTTFVASGGDKRWIAFGEGNTPSRAGRLMMARDTAGTNPQNLFFSPGITVTDLTNNASERIYGLAINRNSSLVGVHGLSSYFADADDLAFHQRLQGQVATGPGAGIAFHPDNDGTAYPADSTTRVAFVATNQQSILIVDSYFYQVRGEIPLNANLVGPMIASRPFPGDPVDVVVKLFGMTANGMIVIDVRRADIDNKRSP